MLVDVTVIPTFMFCFSSKTCSRRHKHTEKKESTHRNQPAFIRKPDKDTLAKYSSDNFILTILRHYVSKRVKNKRYYR